MQIKVLGCSGSRFPGSNLCSFLIGESFVLDAGSITSSLAYEEQKKIKHVLISHSHLDHTQDIAFLADNIQDHLPPLKIVSSREILDIIKNNFLNNKIWPDFSRIPDIKNPTLQYYPIDLNTPVAIENLTVRIVRVNHLVPTVGCFISDRDTTVLFTSDTGPTQEIWETARSIPNLKSVFVDVSFPDRLQKIADLSKHLTPKTLAEELKKLKKSIPVYAYHLKQRHAQEIIEELGLICPEVRILREREVLTFDGR